VPRIVVPFRGAGAKQRVAADEELRGALALAMLGDVLAACVKVAPTVVVTDDPRARAEAAKQQATAIDDPGFDQGAAVGVAAREEPAVATLVVNADVPCVRPDDLRALLRATPPGGLALVAAEDGTTNALSLAEGRLFAPLYGPDSAERFCAHAAARGARAVRVKNPNLADDVDTLDDLYRLQYRAGLRTQAAIALLRKSA
jgi:2-phospho-L-lactate guanylyltransferase